MNQAGEGRKVMAQGRLVWSSGKTLFEGKQKTDMNTKQVRRNAQGEIMMEYGFGLAIPKANFQAIYNEMYMEALTLFPNGQVPPGFAMKMKDGDGVDPQGRPYSQREGYAGCFILACTTSLSIRFFRNENGTNILINEGIKVGDYVQAQIQIKAHPGQGQAKPGLYLNPTGVQFLGYGKEIVNAPSGDDIFGTTAPALPPGASATPLTGLPPIPGAPQPGYPAAPPMAPPGYPQPGAPYAPPAPPAAAPVPHYAVLPPAHQPPPGGMPMAPQPPAYPQPAAPYPQPGYPPAPGYAQPAPPQYQQPAGSPMPPMPGYPGAPR